MKRNLFLLLVNYHKITTEKIHKKATLPQLILNFKHRIKLSNGGDSFSYDKEKFILRVFDEKVVS